MKSKIKIMTFVTMAALMFPQTAFANVVWPSIYIAEGLRCWYIILAGLVVEALFIKFFANKTIIQAGLISLTINTISTLVGVLLIPLVGFFGAIFIGMILGAIFIGMILDAIVSGLGNTFDTAMWICEYILTVLTNVAVEGIAARLIFKIRIRKSFWWLLLGNAVSVVICILVFGFTLREIIH